MEMHMNSDRYPDLPSDLKAFEAQLAALSPACGLSRDELMYRAGWEACASVATPLSPRLRRGVLGARRNARDKHIRQWLWPATTAALVVLSVTLGFVVALRKPATEVVYIERSPPARMAANDKRDSQWRPEGTDLRLPSGGNDYLMLRDRVLALGVDVLPTTAAALKPDARSERNSTYGAMRGVFRDG
jgi:hypothetical protein